VLAATVAVTAVWSHQLLARTPAWHPSLRVVILVAGFAAAAAIVGLRYVDRRLLAVVGAAAVLTGVAGPAAYVFDTVATSHSGAIPSAGPAGQGFAGPGGAGGAGGPGAPAGGRSGGQFRPPTGGAQGLGGLLDTATPSGDLVAALRSDASTYTWVAAAVGSNSAAGVQLSTGLAVMAIGGFNGTDPTPTLAQFQALVHAGKVHYFLANGGGRGFGGTGGGPGGGPGGPGAGSASSSAITTWVEQTFTATTIGGVTVYDLTATA
jgi:4-amino-4-deoxy-L-arabinose transferase-like glycosyltransferase